jgi:quercetin dioxygenase-like cupin family protein
MLKTPRLLGALLIGFLLPSGGALAQPAPTPVPLVAPPGPVAHFATRFDVVDAPERFDQVLLIVDFPAGSWTPVYAPGGSVYTTVIAGEISTRLVGMTDSPARYQAGDTFIETAGDYLAVGNPSGAGARVMSTAMLPHGAPLSVDQNGVTIDAYMALAHGPAPTAVDRAAIVVDRPAGAFELVHLVLDFDPGIWTPRHMHGGQELVVLTAGEITLQRRGGAELFAAGDSWVNTSGLVHAAGNNSADFAQAVATFLLPAGRPLTSVV